MFKCLLLSKNHIHLLPAIEGTRVFVLLFLITRAHTATKTIMSGTMHFDGSSFHELSVLDSSGFNFGKSTSYSIALWFKTERSGTLVSKTTTGANWESLGKTFFVRNSVLGVDSHGIGYIQGTASVVDNNWHHAVFTFDKDTHEFRIYKDFELDATKTLAIKEDDNSHVIRVGQTNDNFIGKFTGEIRDVLYYDRKLTPHDIQMLARTPQPEEVYKTGLYCRVKNYKLELSYNTLNSISLINCAVACSLDSVCRSFNYDKESSPSICELNNVTYTRDIDVLQYWRNETTFSYYSQYTC